MRITEFAGGLLAAAILVAATAAPVQAETALERGTYLVRGIASCGNCHTPKGPQGPIPGMEMAGGFVIDEPPFTARSPNITPDPETGIGKWTDARIIAAIREGRRPDGTIVGPPMPIELYRRMSDTDVKAIVAYLRSVKPVKNKVAKSTYRMPLPKSYGPPVGRVADVNPMNKVPYGRYLAGPLGHCIECHTPQVRGRRDFKNMLGAGGFKMTGAGGAELITPNITPDKETGIGGWTDAQIKATITRGVRPDGSRLAPLMPYPYYATMKPADVDALVAYLRAIKPVNHKVK